MAKMIKSNLYPSQSQGDDNRTPLVEILEGPTTIALQLLVNSFLAGLFVGPFEAFYIVKVQYSNYVEPSPDTPVHVCMITYMIVN